MLLLSVLLFLWIIAGITINMMASFLPFMHQMNNMQNYYNAYYGAVSAVEQGLLASKYKQAGFVSAGTGQNLDTFWGWRVDSMHRSVDARTDNVKDWNVNYLYGDTTRPEMSKLDYNRVATLSFSIDNSERFNSNENKQESTPTQIDQKYMIPNHLQLPERLKESLDYSQTKKDFTNTSITNWRFAISGFNMVKQDGMLYIWLDEFFRSKNNEKIPLLEYTLELDTDIGDKKFDIIGNATARDYTTEIHVEKATKEILSPDFKKSLFPEKPKN